MNQGSDLLLQRVRAATQEEYAIESEIGRGGMAAVFLARDIALDRRVAIKVMLPDLVDVAGIQDRFVIEARTAAHLDHPGIVTVYSVKQRDGLLFIVMKYIEGRTLDQVLAARGALTSDAVATIAAWIAEALHYAHNENVVHRDIKPSNVIIDMHGRPVVTDFGIAKVTSARSITVTGSMLGTPTYMSPEQCRGLPAAAAADQYALGVVLYEMLAGKPPFGGSIFELIHAHCVEAPPPLAARVPGIDPGLEATVMRMLAKDASARFESMAEVVKHLSGSTPSKRRTAEVQASIAAIVRAADAATTPAPRSEIEAAIAAAETQLVTTPAPGLFVVPAEITLHAGQTERLRVSESLGGPPPTARVLWRSEDLTVATVDATGVVLGRSAGFTKITASSGAAFGRAVVTVAAERDSATVVVPSGGVLAATEVLAASPGGGVPARARRSNAPRILAGVGVVLLAAIGGYVVASSGKATPPVTPLPSVPAPAKVDSAARETTVVATPPVPQGRGKADSAPAKQKAQAPPPPRPPADSIVRRCARIQERDVVGETLTAEEKTFRRLYCTG